MAKRVKKADIWEDNGEYLRGFDMMGHEFTAHKPLGLESPLYEDMWVLTVEWGNEDLSDWGDGGHPHIIGEFDSFDELDDFVSREWYNVDRWDGDMGYFGRKAKKGKRIAKRVKRADFQEAFTFEGWDRDTGESCVLDADFVCTPSNNEPWTCEITSEGHICENMHFGVGTGDTAYDAFMDACIDASITPDDTGEDAASMITASRTKRAFGESWGISEEDLEDFLNSEGPWEDEDAVREAVAGYIDDHMIYYDDQWGMLQEYVDIDRIFEALGNMGIEPWLDYENDLVEALPYDLGYWTEENFEKDARKASRKKLSKTALRKKLALYADEVAYDIEGFLKADGPFADEDEVREYIDSCIDNALIYYDDMWKVIEDYGDTQEIWESNPYIFENFFDDVYSQIGDYEQYIEEEGEE